MNPLLLIVTVLLAYILFSKYRESKNLKAIKKLHKLEIIKTALEAREQTLKNISEEIHDNIGQILSVLKMNINSMSTCDPVILNEKIADSKQLICRAIKDLRDLSKSFNADYITEQGLHCSIENELKIVQKTCNFKTRIQTDGKIYRLEKQKELIIFRIFQEIINNIIKHSNANEVVAFLNYSTDKLILKVADNGKGFQLSAKDETNFSSRGLGLKNMYNRAQIIGASLNIKSTKEQGTMVNISIPVI